MLIFLFLLPACPNRFADDHDTKYLATGNKRRYIVSLGNWWMWQHLRACLITLSSVADEINLLHATNNLRNIGASFC
jgi:hypothetical protein